MGCGEGEHAWADAGTRCVRCGVCRVLAKDAAQDAPVSAEGREVAGVRTRRSWTALERRLVCGRTGGDEREKKGLIELGWFGDLGVPESTCPKCGEWVPDYDGFGVLFHPTCGYCQHASVVDGVCSFCGGAIERR